jgi:hypothetical protein
MAWYGGKEPVKLINTRFKVWRINDILLRLHRNTYFSIYFLIKSKFYFLKKNKNEKEKCNKFYSKYR